MRRWLLLGGAVVIGLLATPLLAFAVDRGIAAGEVPRNVTAAGIDLGGLGRDDAITALERYGDAIEAPIIVEVDGEEVTLSPAAIGVAVPVEEAVHRAMEVGRIGPITTQFADWLSSWSHRVDVEVTFGHDPVLLDEVFAEWDRTVVVRPPYDGEVEIRDDVAVALDPVPGAVVDRATAARLIAGLVQSEERSSVEIPLLSVPPALTAAQVRRAAEEVNHLIDTAVIVRDPLATTQLTLHEHILRDAVTVDMVVHSPAALEVRFDREAIARRVAPFAALFTTSPADARLRFDEETATFSVIPSVRGTTIDLDAVGAMVEEAAKADRAVIAPIVYGAEPEWTTEELQAMSMAKVSEFTTGFSCCQSRVRNIELIADAVDGAVVMPGETFSINEHVGPRTTAKGYVRAGAIINGEVYCCDSVLNIGGGTSQFGTTFYNAVFFGCYEDVEHQPHSLYFSRYPRGREATLGYPKPDVVFRNDTGTAVWIDTSHTATSVTVTFYGDTGGRVCTEEVEGRNPITVTRVITHADGTVQRESFTWRYKGTG